MLNVDAPSLRCIRRGQGGCAARGSGLRRAGRRIWWIAVSNVAEISGRRTDGGEGGFTGIMKIRFEKTILCCDKTFIFRCACKDKCPEK